MTGQPMTANDVVLRMLKMSRQLGEVTDRLDKADRHAVEVREDYTLAYAVAFLEAEGAMEVRKQLAIQATHEQRIAAETAEQLVRGLRRQVDTLRMRIEVGRSYGSAIKAELALTSSGVTP